MTAATPKPIVAPVFGYDKTCTRDGYEIRVTTARDLAELQRDWTLLERGKRLPFFLTWHWVSCWLKTYHPKVIAVSASRAGRIVAIGLFTRSLEVRHGLIRSWQLRLHQLGDYSMDQIWMEYNDFICDSEHNQDAVNACLDVLQDAEFTWDEIVLPMMPANRAEFILASNDRTRVGLRDLCYAVDLAWLRETGREYLQSLSANSRYQIRHSIRLYEQKYGELELRRAATVEAALEYFEEAGRFHVLRWPDSGFHNRHFVEFHRNLIADSFGQNNIDLLKLVAGGVTIAVMYYQLVGKKVYFYLHGLRYEPDGKLKPGLVAHAMATEYYIAQGMDQYDYMGGDSQYKMQLARRSEDLMTVIIQRPKLQFWLEQIARNIKQRILPAVS